MASRSSQSGRGLAFFTTVDGTQTWAIDEPANIAHDTDTVVAAVVYPELHSRLVAWWLTHAWRSIDLLEDGEVALNHWRVSTAAVLARAALEQSACLVSEASKIATAWSTAKATTHHGSKRVFDVRTQLRPHLQRATFGTRTADSSGGLQATNVLTYIQGLARKTSCNDVLRWYDWLSDAAHPAFGARIGYASLPFVHDSKAVTRRHYARSPMLLMTPNESTLLDSTIARYAAEALMLSNDATGAVLLQALAVVDDVGLTTGAAQLTTTRYWRALDKGRGTQPCPCGCGPSHQSRHRWGTGAPQVQVPPATGD